MGHFDSKVGDIRDLLICSFSLLLFFEARLRIVYFDLLSKRLLVWDKIPLFIFVHALLDKALGVELFSDLNRQLEMFAYEVF